MKSIIFKLICEFSQEDGIEIYSKDSIDALIIYLESLSNVGRKEMAAQFKTETNKIHGLIIPKSDPHKKCKEENSELRKELDELKFMFMEHLKVCKM